MTEEITVVLPTRDRWALVQDALASALAQHDVSLEVWVVDDNSRTPAPPGLDDDPRVRLIRNDVHLGVAASRNRGIEAAGADWIAFLDDDDVWAPWHLERLLDAARSTGAHWAFSGLVVTDLSRKVLWHGPAPTAGDGFERRLLSTNRIGMSCTLVCAEALRTAGGFDPQLSAMADWDLWLRLTALSPPAVSRTFSVGYATHDGAMSLDMDRVRAELPYVAARAEPLFDGCGTRFADDEDFWRWVAHGYERRGRRLKAARFFLTAATKASAFRNVVRAVGALPVLGMPVRLRRRVVHARRPPRLLGGGEFDWLRSFSHRDEDAVPAVPAIPS